MADRPLIFSAPMIRALLDGRNPWVCALTFTVHRGNIDRMGVA